MYFIKSKPNENGNYGNPTSIQFENSLILPDELLAEFIKYKGFIVPTVAGEEITSIKVNQKALDAYLAEYPDVEDPEPAISAEEQMRADIDYLAIMMGVEL